MEAVTCGVCGPLDRHDGEHCKHCHAAHDHLERQLVLGRPQTVDPVVLREQRIKAGLTQGQMAAQLDVPQTSLSHWERGTPAPLDIQERWQSVLADLTTVR